MTPTTIKTIDEQDLIDLIEYADDHIRNIKRILDDYLDEATIDFIVAETVRAKRRLDQLVNVLEPTDADHD